MTLNRAYSRDLDGLTPALWLGASGFYLAEALLVPGHFGWPWVAAALVCQVQAVRSDHPTENFG